jgi:hypothetical protein
MNVVERINEIENNEYLPGTDTIKDQLESYNVTVKDALDVVFEYGSYLQYMDEPPTSLLCPQDGGGIERILNKQYVSQECDVKWGVEDPEVWFKLYLHYYHRSKDTSWYETWKQLVSENLEPLYPPQGQPGEIFVGHVHVPPKLDSVSIQVYDNEPVYMLRKRTSSFLPRNLSSGTNFQTLKAEIPDSWMWPCLVDALGYSGDNDRYYFDLMAPIPSPMVIYGLEYDQVSDLFSKENLRDAKVMQNYITWSRSDWETKLQVDWGKVADNGHSFQQWFVTQIIRLFECIQRVQS